jgi:hypothetical protein
LPLASWVSFQPAQLDEMKTSRRERGGFRAAQLATDTKAVDALCAALLSYSHSRGVAEEEATFIADATSAISKLLSLEYLDRTIRVVDIAAVVQFHWAHQSQSGADGTRSSANLHIPMHWQNQVADQKRLSRATTKL